MASSSSFVLPLLGGALIGLAASLALYFHGRAAGISGILGGAFLPGHDGRSFRWWFLAGLIVSGVVFSALRPSVFESQATSVGAAAIAGLLVGYGTRLGGGCTSGHGVCGTSRMSTRSIVATGVFMATAMITVFIVKHALGGLS